MAHTDPDSIVDDDDSIADTGVAVGDVLAGKYRVLKVIGVGGMGVVVQAQHMDLDEKVALKFVNLSLLKHGDSVRKRFLREAKAVVRIKSEHVARVRDVGTLDSGAPYIVLEYLEGCDLHDLLDAEGSVEPGLAVEYVLQTCEALAQAHALGIVHRDLKPPNLFVTERPDGSPCIKVLDFGISKLLSGEDAGSGDSLTKTDTLIGSPLYMPPELWESAKNADMRSDIWSLGAILYEMISGESPYHGATMAEVCRAILNDMPPSLVIDNPDIPQGLDDVVMKCMAKVPDDRYDNVGELAVDLVPFGNSSSCRMYARRVIGVLDSAGVLSGPLSIPGESEVPPSIDAPAPPKTSRRAPGETSADTPTRPALGYDETVHSAEDAKPRPAEAVAPIVETSPGVESTRNRERPGRVKPVGAVITLAAAAVAIAVGIKTFSTSDNPNRAPAVTPEVAAPTGTTAESPKATAAARGELADHRDTSTEPAATAEPSPSAVTTTSATAEVMVQPKTQPRALPKPRHTAWPKPKSKPNADDVFEGFD